MALLSYSELKKADFNRNIQKWFSQNDIEIPKNAKSRWDIFKWHVEMGRPFETESGEQITVDHAAYPKVEEIQAILDKADSENRDLTKQEAAAINSKVGFIVKTAEFGGKTETTAGSTEDVESLVAIFLAIGLQTGTIPGIVSLDPNIKLPNLKLDKPTSRVIQQFDSKNVDFKKGEALDHWASVCQATAQVLLKMFKRDDRNYLVYRTPSQIYDKFNELNERYGNRNKWNPADIWLIDSSFSLPNTTGSKEEQWETFNSAIRESFNNRTAIGISLKELNDLQNPKIKPFNVAPKEEWESEAKKIISPDDCVDGNFEFQITGPGSSKFLWKKRKKDGKFEEEINFRLANERNFTSFAAECNFSDSKGQGGKAGLSAINYELKHIPGTQRIPTSLGKDSDLAQQFIHRVGDDFTKYKELLTIYAESLKEGVDYENLVPAKMLSKYFSLLCYDNFMKMKVEDRYKFLVGILDYAMSATNDAAPFIKVY